MTRRALFIAPFALAGMVPLCSCREDEASIVKTGADTGEEVTVVEFNDAGAKLGPARVAKMVRSNAEWHKLLSAEQYYVTRRQGTDIAFSGTYYQMHAAGLFRCICCDDAVFSSDTKFDSGTGWPSFWAPIAEENVRTRTDMRMFIKRIEVHCTRCEAHLVRLFNDGQDPTYQRSRINESSLRFVPQV